MNRRTYIQRFGSQMATASRVPCRALMRAVLYALLACVIARASPAWANIYYNVFSVSEGQVIPGTQDITPGPGIDLSGWNTPGHELEFASLNSTNLTEASFANSDLTNANLLSSTLTNSNFTGTIIKGAVLNGTTVKGFTSSQLYSTASYASSDLTGIGLVNNNLGGWNFANQNLTNASFRSEYYSPSDLTNANFTNANLTNAILTGGGLALDFTNFTNANLSNAYLGGPGLFSANFSDADLRGAIIEAYGFHPNNTIQPDGSIQGLALLAGEKLIVRNNPIAITVNTSATFDPAATLQFLLDKNWTSPVGFTPGLTPALGGTMDLEFTQGVDPANLLGQSFQLFDWTGVTESGAFTITGPYSWDLSQLYTTGDVTLTAVPEPSSLLLASLAGVAMLGLCVKRKIPMTRHPLFQRHEPQVASKTSV